jgi:hypothetical protein
MNIFILKLGSATWDTIFGVSFLLIVFVARAFLKARNHGNRVNKDGH